MFWYQGTLIEEVGVQIPVEVIYSLLTSNFSTVFSYSIRTKSVLCLWSYTEELNRKLLTLQEDEEETQTC